MAPSAYTSARGSTGGRRPARATCRKACRSRQGAEGPGNRGPVSVNGSWVISLKRACSSYPPGRELASPLRSRQRSRRPRRLSRRPRRLRGRRGVRGVGAQATSDRGGVRVRGARRARRPPLRLGRRAAPAGTLHGEHVPGPLPRPRQPRRRLGRHRAGREVPAEPLRTSRHRRQRLGMVQRLVSTGHLRDSSRRSGASRTIPAVRPTASIPRSPASPSAFSAAARSSAPASSARATSSAHAAAASRRRVPATSDSAACVAEPLTAGRRHGLRSASCDGFGPVFWRCSAQPWRSPPRDTRARRGKTSSRSTSARRHSA